MVDPSTPQPRIGAADLERVDLRVARVLSAASAEGTRAPSRVLDLDVGPLGRLRSIGRYALVDERDLVGRNVVACVNLGERRMGRYVSQALVLGAPHPASAPHEAQATPLWVADDARPGDRVF